MRIIDADILSYGLVENHIATPYTKPIIERGITGELEIYVTITTLLETYNVLYWYYKVRPRESVAKKILLVAEGLKLITPSENGLRIAVDDNVPLGDAILIATAIENKLPIVISNDKHIETLCKKYGLIYENPIPENIKQKIR